MITVGIRELKNRLSDFVRLVGQGEVVLVTHRNHVVASLGPSPELPEGSEGAGFERMCRTLRVRRGAGVPPSAHGTPYPRIDVDVPAILDSLRSDRLDK